MELSNCELYGLLFIKKTFIGDLFGKFTLNIILLLILLLLKYSQTTHPWQLHVYNCKVLQIIILIIIIMY